LLRVLNVSQRGKTTSISGVLRSREGGAPQAVKGREFKGFEGFEGFEDFERFEGFKVSAYWISVSI
jgi:hypothetical protein